MATLKLKKPTDSRKPTKPSRPPLRGAGSVARARPTLAQAQAERQAQPQHSEQHDHPLPQAKPRRSIRDATHDAHGFEERHRRRLPEGERRANRPYPDSRPGSTNSTYSNQSDRFSAAPEGNRAFDGQRDYRHERHHSEQERHQQPYPTEQQENSRFDPRYNHQAPQTESDAFRRDHRRTTHHHNAAGSQGGSRHDKQAHNTEQPESLRLSKRMSQLGMASRREADEWIPKGWVRVDGQVVRELGSRVIPGQHITIDAKARNQQAARVTILINKPVGYVSGQAEDGYEPALVLVTPQNQWREDRSSVQFLREHLRNLAPAGRLDIDSVGLLVLTQDGRIAKQLIGEDSEVEKEYLVRVHTQTGHALPDESLALLNHGLELDGQALRPALVEWVNDDQLRFVLREGRKRQIRRMCEAVGLNVLGLKRVRIGQVMLGHLPPGHWRYLRGDESFLKIPDSIEINPAAQI